MKYNFVNMLQELHRRGVVIKVQAGATNEQWHVHILGLFEFHCMPDPRETTQETALIVCSNRGWLGKSGEWKKPWSSKPVKQQPKQYKKHSYRSNRRH